MTAKIAAVVVFGDPYYGQAVGGVAAEKVLSICHLLDIICTGVGDFTTREYIFFSLVWFGFAFGVLFMGGLVGWTFLLIGLCVLDLTYGNDAGTASAFIVKAVGTV